MPEDNHRKFSTSAKLALGTVAGLINSFNFFYHFQLNQHLIER